jgi:hypothetical protein
MKTKSLILIAFLAFAGLTAFTIAEDILGKLGMDAGTAQSAILANLT